MYYIYGVFILRSLNHMRKKEENKNRVLESMPYFNTKY